LEQTRQFFCLYLSFLRALLENILVFWLIQARAAIDFDAERSEDESAPRGKLSHKYVRQFVATKSLVLK